MLMESLVVPGKLESLGRIGEYVMDVATSAGLARRDAYRLRLAVDEIATNAIVHGYEEVGTTGDLIVRAEYDDRHLRLILEDAGPAYDPLSTPPPDDLDQPLSDRDIGGLGVFLALKGVDEFRYSREDEKNYNIFVMNRTDTGDRAKA